jgi:hypothetical protein
MDRDVLLIQTVHLLHVLLERVKCAPTLKDLIFIVTEIHAHLIQNVLLKPVLELALLVELPTVVDKLAL